MAISPVSNKLGILVATLLNPKSKIRSFFRVVAGTPTILGAVAILIPLVGLALEVGGVQSAFERSGSLLVCIAIMAVFINHYVEDDISTVDSRRNAILKYGRTAEEIKKHIPRNMKDKERDKIASLLHRTRKTGDDEHFALKGSKEAIVRIEFGAGIIGTVIWGLGGLIRHLI